MTGALPLAARTDRLPSLFGGFGKSEDWSTIEQIINDMGVLHSLLLNYSKNIAKATQIISCHERTLRDIRRESRSMKMLSAIRE